MSIEIKFTTPDHNKMNGFGRDYIQSQLEGDVRDDHLLELREELSDIHEYLENGFVETTSISPWLQNQLSTIATQGILTNIADKHDGEYIISDGLFENMIQANNYSLSRLTSELRPDFDGIVGKFKTNVNELVSKGLLPTDATKRLGDLDTIGFAVSEGYAAYDAMAACEHGENGLTDIIVSYQAIEAGRLDEITIFHELVHAIAGRPARDSLKKYLAPILPDKRAVHDVTFALEEVLTEHIAQVVLGQRTCDDATVEHDPKAYGAERAFLTDISNDVSIQELVNVYFGGPGSTEQAAALKKLLSESIDLAAYFHLADYDEQDANFSTAFALIAKL